MPGSSLKELYVAKSISELNDSARIDVDKISSSRLIKSAEKIFKVAEENYLKKDEEVAYVQYMRFVEIILILNNRDDFKSNKSQYKSLFASSNSAIARAELLRKSLTKRYSFLEEANLHEKNAKNRYLFASQSENSSNKPQDLVPEENNIVEKQNEASTPEHSITSQNLFNSMGEGKNFIIMDCRPEADYTYSHIKSSKCISIPQEILKPGIIAASLETKLPTESLFLWYKRAEADYVILIDWDSKSGEIEYLKQAMCKWDQKCALKNPPLVLEGGYNDWMVRYPMYTTQPLKMSLLSDVKPQPVIADISAVEYPNLDENIAQKNILTSKKVNNNDVDALFIKSVATKNLVNGAVIANENTSNRSVKSAPMFDRSCKPSTSRDLKSSGTVKKQATTGPTSNAPKNNTPEPQIKNTPSVSRVSKPNSSNSNSDESGSTANQRQDDSLVTALSKEESLVKENLEITQQRLNQESEFEKLRLRKELEAEENKRTEIQRQEEALIHKLKQLELQSKEKDAECVKVKAENMKLKKMLEEQTDKEYQKQKEKEISNAELKKKQLQEEVERLREERKRKQAAQKRAEINKTEPAPREISSANSALKRSQLHHNQDQARMSTEYSVPLAGDGGTSRGLVRSHSSPNIAQLDDETPVHQERPLIDRSNKPKIAPNNQTHSVTRLTPRNLNPVYGNCPVRPATGLRNLGNTCFMNSVIQCLSNTIPLAMYFVNDLYIEDINRNSKHGTGGELAEEFAIVIHALWMGHYKSFSPKDFKNTVSRCLSVCIGNEQQDSHEFLVTLMEKLHADLNKKRASLPIPNLDVIPDEKIRTQTFWLHHKSCNSSKISEIFDGLLKSTLTCLSCGAKSNNYEVFSCLPLPILTSKCTLKDCLQLFFKHEKMSGEAAWGCPKCKQKKEAEKRLHICRLPDILVIQLKRFSYEGLWRRKLQTYVDFDTTFEMPHHENGEERSRSYNLYGIVNHYGTLEGGHYTAFCRTTTRKWYKFDDHEVTEISSSDIKTSAAYLLFYTSVDFRSSL